VKDFAVTWEIDVQADSPLEAARIAWNTMRARGSIANVFTVCDDEGNIDRIDLQAEKEES
jgi:hypothetical protein